MVRLVQRFVVRKDIPVAPPGGRGKIDSSLLLLSWSIAVATRGVPSTITEGDHFISFWGSQGRNEAGRMVEIKGNDEGESGVAARPMSGPSRPGWSGVMSTDDQSAGAELWIAPD